MTYQPFGAVESMTLGNGLAAANDRGTDGRLGRRRLTNVSSSAMPVGLKLSDLSYVYDPAGNGTSIAYDQGGNPVPKTRPAGQAVSLAC